ncbi:SsgA family sporulation/cell division regulator [Nocardioides terrigena]|uniref:SsgA family sporulation/cell division regulator n=1 Tax=Nocardioides terrigena TaxID=424797 RepID=UPI000D324A13|nr:SsgA family sporulation/cell division regulator [Nocardioides terrigena]
MRRITADVAVDVTMYCRDLDGHRYELDTVLGYARSDAFAVTMTFGDVEPLVTWTFGRDLLMRGITHPTGEGDVRICPSLDDDGTAIVQIELCSPDGHLLLEVRTDEVTAFIGRTVDVCPPGVEADHVDVDQMIAQLLAV